MDFVFGGDVWDLAPYGVGHSEPQRPRGSEAIIRCGICVATLADSCWLLGRCAGFCFGVAQVLKGVVNFAKAKRLCVKHIAAESAGVQQILLNGEEACKARACCMKPYGVGKMVFE